MALCTRSEGKVPTLVVSIYKHAHIWEHEIFKLSNYTEKTPQKKPDVEVFIARAFWDGMLDQHVFTTVHSEQLTQLKINNNVQMVRVIVWWVIYSN